MRTPTKRMCVTGLMAPAAELPPGRWPGTRRRCSRCRAACGPRPAATPRRRYCCGSVRQLRCRGFPCRCRCCCCCPVTGVQSRTSRRSCSAVCTHRLWCCRCFDAREIVRAHEITVPEAVRRVNRTGGDSRWRMMTSTRGDKQGMSCCWALGGRVSADSLSPSRARDKVWLHPKTPTGHTISKGQKLHHCSPSLGEWA